MALTVREQKAGSVGGYRISAPVYGSHPLRLVSQASRSSSSKTVMHRAVLKPGPPQAGRDGARGSTARPVIGPMGLKSRRIIN